MNTCNVTNDAFLEEESRCNLTTDVCFCDPSSGRWYNEVYAFRNFFPNIGQAAIIYGIVYPLLSVITVITNIFVVLVLSQKRMLSPTNIILRFMATADLFVAIVPLPFTAFYFSAANYNRGENVAGWWCWLQLWLTDALPPIFHNIAIWLAVLLAVQRLIYVNYPHVAKHYCTIPNTRRAAAIIVAVAVLACSPRFFVYAEFAPLRPGEHFVLISRAGNETESNITKLATEACYASHTALYKLSNRFVFPLTFYSTRALLFVYVPSIMLVIVSILLAIALRRARRRQLRLLSERRRGSRVEARRISKANQTGLMLLLIVGLFLLVNLPQAVGLTLVCISMAFEVELYEPRAIFLAMSIDNMLILATYPLNFAIYCGMSKQFRDTFRRLSYEKPRAFISGRSLATETTKVRTQSSEEDENRGSYRLEPQKCGGEDGMTVAQPEEQCARERKHAVTTMGVECGTTVLEPLLTPDSSVP